MAGIAKHARIVIRGHDLWEIARLGGIFLVATDAKRGHVRERGFGGGRVAAIGVRRLRPMARFARNMSVLTRGTCLGLAGVTQEAPRLAGEYYRPRADQIQRRRAIVAVSAKALGDQSLANQQEDCHAGQQDERRAHQMTGIPEESPHTPNQAARNGPVRPRAWPVDSKLMKTEHSAYC